MVVDSAVPQTELLGALGLVLSGLTSVASTFPPFDALLTITLPLMLLRLADQALYHAKYRGRSRSVTWTAG